jgi:4-hydroxybutyryl-CoA dehydratase/vinylacetyl-CoA-Delta-isomerase
MSVNNLYKEVSTMGLLTFDDYLESLRDGREVYYRGQRVADVTKHPILRLAANLMKHFFDEKYLYDDPELGVRTSKFYKVPRSSADLLERSQLTYEITKDAVTILPHICTDGINALMIITSKLEDKYRERVINYANEIMKNNLFFSVATIDVRGDRRLRPIQQEDPDLYVHVVDERDDGIIVRGAKMHTGYSTVDNGIFVLPGRSLREGEGDYAIAFAVPANAKGLKLIQRPCIATEAALHNWEGVRTRKEIQIETLTIFDNVFVPWEHVFIYKDIAAGGRVALMFALQHRLSAISYRYALAEYLIGLGKLIAQANGVDRAAHIVGDIKDLITYAEIQRMCAKMAAYECHIDEPSGIAIPNSTYTNIGKMYSNENYLPTIRSLIDIAGGIAITAPSGDDYASKELRPYIDKYLRGAIPGEDRFKLMLLLREWIALWGEGAGYYIHAEGSIRASIIELVRSYDYAESEGIVERLLSRME